MQVAWGGFTSADGASYRQIEISGTTPLAIFDRVAEILKDGLDGLWHPQLDSFDQRYWDMHVNGGRITLHLEHHLGITLYPTSGAEADEQSLELLRRAYQVLTREEHAGSA